MKNLFKVVLAFVGTLMCLSASYAVPNHDHPTTFLGPTLRGTYTDSYNSFSAYSLSGEAGLKNFRVGGTLGWQLAENQRLKLSAEYLWQKITYPFFAGNTDQWVQQGAVGGLYQYRFCNVCWDPTFDLRAWYSHAPSKSLSTATGVIRNNAGILLSFADFRRIAGSNAGGIAPGFTIHPWTGTYFGADLNYDNVKYDKNHSPNEDARGFGGTVRLGQVLTDNIVLDLSAAVRQPFNTYSASLDWLNVSYYGRWTLSLDGAYTAGKHTLPSTWNVGVNANYYVDQTCDSICQRRAAAQFTHCDAPDPFLVWASDPAVYLPQVLAIPDEDVVIPDPRCSQPVPVVIAAIPPFTTTTIGTSTFTTAQAFSPSSGLSYTISVTPAPAGGNSVTINTATGVVTVVNAGTNQTVTATVTAINICGAAAASAPIVITYRTGG